jgi:hypothetical protein
MTNHLKIGSAILNPGYFWTTGCPACTTSPEVHHHPDESSPPHRLEPAKLHGGLPSFRFELSRPGIYSLRNFCGGGFHFDARVRVRNGLIEVMQLQGAGEG